MLIFDFSLMIPPNKTETILAVPYMLTHIQTKAYKYMGHYERRATAVTIDILIKVHSFSSFLFPLLKLHILRMYQMLD